MIAIDPGSSESAWVMYVDGALIEHRKESNFDVLERLRFEWEDTGEFLAIEMIASYGMAVGKEVFDTCVWIGRFAEAWQRRGWRVDLVYRKDVKLFHCETSRANDSNIRAALIDRYGPGKDKAIGKKASPGPLYGLVGDEWSALAVALTAEGKQLAATVPF
jgi:hypothetical protein